MRRLRERGFWEGGALRVRLGIVRWCRKLVSSSIANSVGKMRGKASPGTQTPMPQPIAERIRRQTIDGGNDLPGESLAQARLPRRIPGGGLGGSSDRFCPPIQGEPSSKSREALPLTAA